MSLRVRLKMGSPKLQIKHKVVTMTLRELLSSIDDDGYEAYMRANLGESDYDGRKAMKKKIDEYQKMIREGVLTLKK